MPRAGQYDQEIAWLRNTVTGQNSYGEDIVTPATIHQCWASVTDIMQQGRESTAALQRWAEARYVIKMRPADVELRASDWIEWNGQTLDVVSPVQGQNMRTREWVIYAKDHVA
jgi:head-tail adaptor